MESVCMPLSLRGGDRRWLTQTGTLLRSKLQRNRRERMGGAVLSLQRIEQKAKALWAMKPAWGWSEQHYDPARKGDIFGQDKKKTSGIWGGTSQRPVGGTGESVGMFGESLLGLAFGCTVCRCQQWPVVLWARRFCKRRGKGPIGKGFGLTQTMG